MLLAVRNNRTIIARARRLGWFLLVKIAITDGPASMGPVCQNIKAGRDMPSANTPSGWRSCNLPTQFQRILKRAGLTPVVPCDEASWEIELAKEFPIHKGAAWLGKTARIAQKHRVTVTEEDLLMAAKKAACSTRDSAHNPAQHGYAENRGGWQESGHSSNPSNGRS